MTHPDVDSRPYLTPSKSLDFPGTGPEPSVTFPDLTRGLAIVGPADARVSAFHGILAAAAADGRRLVLLSLGRDAGLVDAAIHAAGNASGIAVVDADAEPGRSHRIDPFCECGPEAILRLAGACSPALAEETALAGRARALLGAVVGAHVSFRDAGLLDISAEGIVDALEIRRLIDLGNAEFYPSLPAGNRVAVERHLSGLGGYQEERKYKQNAPVLEAHAPMAALAADGLSWMRGSRYAALSASSTADLTLLDIASSGTSVALRASAQPGEDRAVRFLAWALAEALRLRKAGDPLLVVVDGADALPMWQCSALAAHLGKDIGLVFGMDGLRGEGPAALAFACGLRLVLPGVGPRGLEPLDLYDAQRRDCLQSLSKGRASLLARTTHQCVDVPSRERPAARGELPDRTRSTSRDGGRSRRDEPLPEVLALVLSPELRRGIEPPAGDAAIDAVVRSFSAEGDGRALDAAARAALGAIAGNGHPADGRVADPA